MENLKEIYNEAFAELDGFLGRGKTYKDMTVEQFKEEVREFWERTEIWNTAVEQSVYNREKLDSDFEKVRMQAKRILL